MNQIDQFDNERIHGTVLMKDILDVCNDRSISSEFKKLSYSTIYSDIEVNCNYINYTKTVLFLINVTST